jgi:hypothetical protein
MRAAGYIHRAVARRLNALTRMVREKNEERISRYNDEGGKAAGRTGSSAWMTPEDCPEQADVSLAWGIGNVGIGLT